MYKRQEPTSALSARDVEWLGRRIAELRERGTTVVLITHRVAAAAQCDEVVVIDEGTVVARGTHDELARQGGLYAVFAEEQRAARELEELESTEPPRVAQAPGEVAE